MNSLIVTAIAVLLSAATVLAVGWLPVARPPVWAKSKEDGGPGAPEEWSTSAHWRRLAPWPIAAALLAIAVVTVPLVGDNFFRALAITMSTGVVTLSFAYSAITDLKIRLVDRRVLNWSLLASAVTSTAYLVYAWDPVTAITAGIMYLLGAIVYLFMPAVGASDARALMLIGVAAVPPIGWAGFVWGTYLSAAFFIIAGVAMAMVKRRMKISVPAVPILLGPYLVMVMYSAFAAFGAVNMP